MRINCPIKGHEQDWIEVVDAVKHSLWMKWLNADVTETEQLLLHTFITNWHLTTMDGSEAPAPATKNALDDLDQRIVYWLSAAFSQHIITSYKASPNSEGALPNTLSMT